MLDEWSQSYNCTWVIVTTFRMFTTCNETEPEISTALKQIISQIGLNSQIWECFSFQINTHEQQKSVVQELNRTRKKSTGEIGVEHWCTAPEPGDFK